MEGGEGLAVCIYPALSSCPLRHGRDGKLYDFFKNHNFKKSPKFFLKREALGWDELIKSAAVRLSKAQHYWGRRCTEHT